MFKTVGWYRDGDHHNVYEYDVVVNKLRVSQIGHDASAVKSVELTEELYRALPLRARQNVDLLRSCQ